MFGRGEKKGQSDIIAKLQDKTKHTLDQLPQCSPGEDAMITMHSHVPGSPFFLLSTLPSNTLLNLDCCHVSDPYSILMQGRLPNIINALRPHNIVEKAHKSQLKSLSGKEMQMCLTSNYREEPRKWPWFGSLQACVSRGIASGAMKCEPRHMMATVHT